MSVSRIRPAGQQWDFKAAVRRAFTAGLVIFLVAVPSIAEDADQEDQSDQQQARIERLIKQLGHENFILRERAQTELREIGPPALDALAKALSDKDVEIVMRARYLMSAITINWALDSDPPRVQSLLKDYGAKSDADRRETMKLLATTGGNAEIEALCRMIRYERLPALSKYAALLIIDDKSDAAETGAREAIVLKNIKGCKRGGAQWLRVYFKHRKDLQALAQQWEKITAAEKKLLEQPTNQTRYDVVQSLLFQLVDMLAKAGRQKETEPYMRAIVNLQPDQEGEGIQNLVKWLFEKQAAPVVEAVAKKFPHIFEKDALLMYSLAQARHQVGNTEQAEEAVQKALKLSREPEAHYWLAYELQHRGWFHWAEREYRHLIQTQGFTDPWGVRAVLLLAEMFHDQAQEQKAGDTMKELVQLMQQNLGVKRLVQAMRRDAGGLQSRMHYFYACQHLADGDVAKQTAALDRAIADDPHDADVLIALYRLANQSAARRDRTLKMIRTSIAHFRSEIKADPDEATPYNQFAWLVGNTLGETDRRLGEEAIRYSHKSLEIRPDAGGFMDTLGRCYYAVGDYENAVKYQAQALRLDPHSGLIHRQLELFEQAYAKSKKAK